MKIGSDGPMNISNQPSASPAEFNCPIGQQLSKEHLLDLSAIAVPPTHTIDLDISTSVLDPSHSSFIN